MTLAYDGSEIAVIGISLRFPGATTVDGFWHNLASGAESITFFSNEELLADGVPDDELRDPQYVKAAGILNNVAGFDADLFGYSPSEARMMDPQQRILLECAWQALENAGYDPVSHHRSIGVFVGSSASTYLLHLASDWNQFRSFDPWQLALGNDFGLLSTRLSYKLNLSGPSYSVHTECSTSLVSVHLACQSLLIDECQMALAGGVSIRVPQRSGYLYEPDGIQSPDGHCRAFDEEAGGTVFGSGAALVVLKRLDDARTDGDHIYAIIRGSATNNDGSLKASFTAPSVEGQTAVIKEAMACAGLTPACIGYVEAHGTGTALGDPIELLALTKAFGPYEMRSACAIGSVKSNIGHLDAAAGIASLIKVVLGLKNKQIPPSLHYVRPNPKIDFAQSPFYVNATLSDWPVTHGARRGAVSSFGFGGTNAHVILEEAPHPPPQALSEQVHLLILSAKTQNALDAMIRELSVYLYDHPSLSLSDVAYTLQVGRHHFAQRCAVVCSSTHDAVQRLSSLVAQRVADRSAITNRPVVFMFPGQGAQFVNMLAGLYQSESVFQKTVDQCIEMLQPHVDLRSILYVTDDKSTWAAELLLQTRVAQPALFVVEYALAQLWLSWGVRPVALIGHSVGEWVAACLAGVCSLPEALKMVAIRGQLMQAQQTGMMLGVALCEDDLAAYLDNGVEIAAVNGTRQCVVSGPHDAVAALIKRLELEGIPHRLLHTSHAFHSAAMIPAADAFARSVESVTLAAPRIPIMSNVSGTWLTAEQATDPQYWASHIRQTVRFGAGVQAVVQDRAPLLLEIGPGCTLTTLLRDDPALGHTPVVATGRHPREQQADMIALLQALATAWTSGVAIDWSRFSIDKQRWRVPLPSYTFDRQTYWLSPRRNSTAQAVSAPSPNKKADVASWFYVPTWTRLSVVASAAWTDQFYSWLVFVDTRGLGEHIVAYLEAHGQSVSVVAPGACFDSSKPGYYSIQPDTPDDYGRLVHSLIETQRWPQRIVHLWNITSEGAHVADDGFGRLIWLLQAVGAQAPTVPLHLSVIANNLFFVESTDRVIPEKALLLGACRVIPLEYPYISCQSIDIVPDTSETMIASLVAACAQPSKDQEVAYRGRHRWVPSYEPLRLPNPEAPPVRPGGVYLITGGLGGLGLALAEYLAATAEAKLVLVQRRPFPAPASWTAWLDSHDAAEETSQIISRLQALESYGAEVLIAQADVSNAEQMRAVLGQAEARFGRLHGVIHAAGVPGGGLIQLKTAEAVAEVLAAKVGGTRVLEHLLAHTPLDFLVLFSSTHALLGDFGLADYCAANAFLDSFTYHAMTSRLPTPVITINWDVWAETGMTVQVDVPELFRAQHQERMYLGMSTAEGVRAFVLAIGGLQPQIIVSTQDLELRVQQGRDSALNGNASLSNSHVGPATRAMMSVDYVAPHTDLQYVICDIWREMLGIDYIGILDNYFDLGGHSLMAIRIVAKIRDILQVIIPVESLFDTPTVEKLADLILTIDGESGRVNRIAAIYRKLSSMSPDEVQASLYGKKVRDT